MANHKRPLSRAISSLLVFMTLVLAALPAAAVGPVGYGARVTVLRSDENSLDLRIETGRPAGREGWLLAAPPNASATLELLPGGAEALPVQISDQGWLRNQWVLRLSLLPGAGRQPEASADVRVRFDSPSNVAASVDVAAPALAADASPAAGQQVEPDAWFESLLADIVLNHEQGLAWRQPPEADPAAPAAQPFYPPRPRLYLEATQEGVYRISGAELLAAGWPAESLDPASLSLHSPTTQIPLFIAGAEDGRVDAEDYLEYYAPASSSRYSASIVYWLESAAPATAAPGGQVAPLPALQQSSPSAFPATLRLEESHLYDSTLARNGDSWYWQRITARAGATQTFSYAFTLHQPAADGEMATLRAQLVSSQSPPHQVQLKINGQMLLDYTWDPSQGPLPSVSFAEELLQDGQNTIQLTVVNIGGVSAQSVVLDWFELAYRQRYASHDDWAAFAAPKPGVWAFSVPGFSSRDLSAYDTTEPSRPRRIADGEIIASGDQFTLRFVAQGDASTRFVAAGAPAIRRPLPRLVLPSSTLAPGQGADWIALARPDLAAGLAPLVARRQAQGLRTRIVDPQAVYDAYSAGLPEPQAIASFLADAFANWPGSPVAFALLAGDGTFDPRNYLGGNQPAGIPVFLAAIDPIIGETADEHAFAAIRGADALPDLAVGRLPVDTPDELAALVAKILAYESLDPWSDGARPPRHFFLADNPDLAGNFYMFADEVAGRLPASHRSQEAYFGLEPYLTAGEASAATVAALNEGLLLLHYVGHGTPDSWGGERLFGPEHIAQLANANQAPPALSMSSLNGYFLDADGQSFLEQMLLAPNGGISAYVASTGVGLILANYLVQDGFVHQTLRRSPPLLGLGLTRGKLAIYTYGTASSQWLARTYSLFGDPAMRLPLPQGGLYLPLLEINKEIRVAVPFAARAPELQPTATPTDAPPEPAARYP